MNAGRGGKVSDIESNATTLHFSVEKATSRTNLTDEVVEAAFSDMLRHKILLTALVEGTAFRFKLMRPVRMAEDIMVTRVKGRQNHSVVSL